MRNDPLDAYRGLAVGGMALVNLEDPFLPSFSWLDHAQWNGMTFADLVFPFFILGVGLSVALAAEPPKTLSWIKVLRRSLALIALGLALNWLLHPHPAFWDIRASGVLQRIGIVYFACAALAKIFSGRWAVLAAALILLAAHGFALLYLPAPGESRPLLTPGMGLSGWLDRHLLPGRLVRAGYDPEGVLSTVSAIATGLLGLFAMRCSLAQAKTAKGDLRLFAGLAGGLIVLGITMCLILPLNKQLWTPSFALLNAGLGIGLLAALQGVWPRIAAWRLSQGFAFLGRYALTFYVAHMVIIAGLMLKADGRRFWDLIVNLAAGFGASAPFASLIIACALTAVTVAAVRGLVKLGWVVRL